MKNSELKNKIIFELEKKEFPNLKFLYSKEVLDVSLDLLREMLNEERSKFEKLLQIPKEKISFEIFDDKDNLSYFWHLLNHLNNVDKTEKIKEIIEEFEWEYIEFWNEVAYNKDYYEMYVYCLENCELDTEQKRIIEETVKNFKLRGIDLDYNKQKELKEINKTLAELSNKFSNNIVDDEANYFYKVSDYNDIKDLPQTTLNLAKQLAEKKGKDWYLFNADPTAYSDLMKYCSNSKIREEIYRDFMNFATKLKFDNRPLILEILKLKNKKAKILGYKNFAEYNMQKKMADSPEQVFELIENFINSL
jgi:oligopeptidase A